MGQGQRLLVQRHTNECPVSVGHARKLQAGIQDFHMDSRQKHAGMTPRDNGHFDLRRCTQLLLRLMPISPRRPEPRSQTAPGMGTGAASVS